MVHITIVREEDYYFEEADIKYMAESNELSVAECKEALLKGEFERSELAHYCEYYDGIVTDYSAKEE